MVVAASLLFIKEFARNGISLPFKGGGQIIISIATQKINIDFTATKV